MEATMRKPRDFDAEMKVLQDKARDLKSRKVLGLGELVIATGADSLKRHNGHRWSAVRQCRRGKGADGYDGQDRRRYRFCSISWALSCCEQDSPSST
jgi:hypothetical protein